MKSKKIIVNGTSVTCYDDGSLEKINLRTGKTVRTFGSDDKNGYKVFYAGGKLHRAHRLIFWAFNGSPVSSELVVDHVNGVTSDNAPENLRLMSNSENLRAHRVKSDKYSSKYRGVYARKRDGKWLAQCRVEGKLQHIGCFLTEVDAARSFDAVAIKSGYAVEGLNFGGKL